MSSISATFDTEVSEFVEREMAIIAGEIDWSDCDEYTNNAGDGYGELLLGLPHKLSSIYLVIFSCTTDSKYRFLYVPSTNRVRVYVQDAASGISAEVADNADISSLVDTKFIAFGRRY